MRTTISLGFAAFVCTTAFAASQQPEAKPGNEPAVVSVDLLRHPINAKVRKLLLSALDKIKSGDHERAIGQLLDTLAKYPDSAPYVYDLLGVAYAKTDRFETAVSSFEKAVLLLPHDAVTHYNFGLALVCVGDYDRAAQEVQRATELDPQNAQMQVVLDTLLEQKRSQLRLPRDQADSSRDPLR